MCEENNNRECMCCGGTIDLIEDSQGSLWCSECRSKTDIWYWADELDYDNEATPFNLWLNNMGYTCKDDDADDYVE